MKPIDKVITRVVGAFALLCLVGIVVLAFTSTDDEPSPRRTTTSYVAKTTTTAYINPATGDNRYSNTTVTYRTKKPVPSGYKRTVPTVNTDTCNPYADLRNCPQHVLDCLENAIVAAALVGQEYDLSIGVQAALAFDQCT